jgi:hypothetical protein
MKYLSGEADSSILPLVLLHDWYVSLNDLWKGPKMPPYLLRKKYWYSAASHLQLSATADSRF